MVEINITIMKKFFILLIFITFVIKIAEAPPLDNSDWFSHDKFSHLTTSTFLYCWNYNLLHNAGNLDKNKSCIISFNLVNFAGITKEIIDSKQSNNKFSYKDLIYDLGGNLLGVLVCK